MVRVPRAAGTSAATKAAMAKDFIVGGDLKERCGVGFKKTVLRGG